MTIEELKSIVRAFVLIKVDVGREYKVMEELLKIHDVKEVHEITGEKDMLIVIETKRDIVVPSSQEVVSIITGKIRKIRGIKDTETIIPVRSMVKKSP